jgi:cellulose 1,4-beta-cellobiosidase
MPVLPSLLLVLGLPLCLSQQIGTQQAEIHPPLTTYTCAAGGTCTPEASSITLDANWRWTHQVGSSTNCYTGDEWDTSICSDPDTCARNCALDGAAYESTYGIHVAGDEMSIKLVTVGQYDTNIGARTYVMDTEDTYKLFMLKNREFTFDVDVSTLPCGINGALYFVDMDSDGGKAKFPQNSAGAAYGTGYCDAQCPHDDKFINGEANIIGWAPDPNGDPNSGDGKFGTCCTEMDIWEANSMATAVTPHAARRTR